MQDGFFFAKQLIPKNWTGEQAHAVVELLDTINAAVWDVHEEKIIDAMLKQNTVDIAPKRDGDPVADNPDDDIPDDIPF